MANAEWSIGVGILVFIIAIVFVTIYYFRYRKLYLIPFIASIATYIFAVMYTWDVFLDINRDRHLILLLLLVSTGLMFYIAHYLGNIKLKPVKSHLSIKQKDD